MRKPDFYLMANEAVPIGYPIKCWILEKTKDKTGNNCFLVEMSPYLLCYENKKIIELDKVLLVARYEGGDIARIQKKPLYVNINKFTDAPRNKTGSLLERDFELIAIGKVYFKVKDVWRDARTGFDKSTPRFWLS